MAKAQLMHKIKNTVYSYRILQIVRGGKVSRISRVNWQTRNLQHLVLKMAGVTVQGLLQGILVIYFPQVSGIMLPSQNYY